LIIEDDPGVCNLLDLLLKDQGCDTATAPDGMAALDLVARGKIRPDLVLADYNLPKGLDGLRVVEKLRALLDRRIPVIVLTGDISTIALRDIARYDCVHLTKPVRLKELTQAVQSLLPASRSAGHIPPVRLREASDNLGQVIYVIDDDSHIRDGLRKALEADGRTVEDFATCEAFLEAYHPGREACLLVDAYLPGMSGLELLHHLSHSSHRLPAIMITGNGDVPMAVQAMKAGALDFIEKPFHHNDLRASVARALDQSRDSSKSLAWREAAASHIAALTPRQRQIMDLVLAGHPSKNIAADLGISQRTVETHRASIMKKTGAKSLPALARLALAAAEKLADEPPVQRESLLAIAR
jgi:two-component system CheB/CheR fusion protein